ncbi:SAM-dependent methyltransferase, partial [Escherichia coli]|uniref:SAM-dependent methyltransferase n=1 Tax=Escherichia coli TaxID=562 RepID=UPI00202F693D
MTRLADSPVPARRYLIGGTTFTARPLEPGLHVVATPIGNLRDITIRAIETMAAADVVACEDTRITRRLLDHFGLTVPLVPYHEH